MYWPFLPMPSKYDFQYKMNQYINHTYILDKLLCTDPFFQCLDGQCIIITNRCNGRSDCKDGTDEIACGMSLYWE